MLMNKLSQQEIEARLIAITTKLLAESGEPYKREIKIDASLESQLGIDSLTRAELFQRVEKEFGIAVPDQLLASADNLQDIAAFLQSGEHGVPHAKIHRTIVTSHGEKSNVDPGMATSLTDILLLYGNKSPEKAHIYFQHEDGQEEIITYGHLLKSALKVAGALKQRGLVEGETVAIMLPTDPGFFYVFFGTLLAGGVPVPIYPPFRMHMLEAYAKTEAHILNSAQVRILVTFERAEKLSRLLQTFVPSLKHVTTVKELLDAQEFSTPFVAKADNFGLIQYTSGSTSDPKGVLLTHANLLANIRAYGKAIAVRPDDVAVSWLPLYHDMGLIGMWLGSLYFGVPLVLLTPFSFLNHPERWLWAIHYHRGTLSGAPNFAYELCVRKIDHAMMEGLDLSSWRMAANGAEKVYPRTLQQFADKFASCGFKREALLPVYGLAESTVGLAIPELGHVFHVDHVDRKQFEEARHAVPSQDKNALAFVACGVPIEGHEIRIVDENDKELPERHIGSLQFRGPSSMQGYYNNPKATAAAYHDGWIDSGDLAYQADKEIYITGRRKDLIIKAGRNLYPAEIEELVGTIQGVRQGCVTAFAVDSERGTEQLVVVAEIREKKSHENAVISERINEAIVSALDIVPDHIVLVPPHTVPKTSSGKLQRAACKSMYMQGKLGRMSVPPWLQITKLGVKGGTLKIMHAIKWLGKLIFTAYLALMVLITLIPFYLIVRFVRPETAAAVCRGWSRFFLYAAFTPLSVIGKENLSVSPMIFAANHASYLDAIIMLAVLPPGIRFVGKKELFNVPVLRTFIKKLNVLAVDRMDLSKGLEDTKGIASALQKGHSILIFPEGTFGYASGLRPFRLGAFKIAAETGIPVCPVAIKGARVMLRADEKLAQPSHVVVTISPPVRAAGSEWQDVTQLRNAVRSEIAQFCGEPSLDYIAAQTVAPKPPGR